MVTFDYGALSVTLPSPALGDSDLLATGSRFQRGMSLSLDGQVFSYKQTPVIETLTLSFRCDAVQMEALLTLLATANGSAISYTDHLGSTYNVHSLSTTKEITSNSRDICNGQHGFKFFTIQLVRA